ncbi:F-box domain, cyclin-like domain containing protein [Rhodotorula toruloides]|uniref:BY PROTMAP: gi/472583972/gb/EMS21588.1/ F-box domain, cyclin-like domain containing protein [Rhodosporidium toruloides NP11] gi/647400388/emb/CDR45789.1/ RHTO0S11e04896g1_1 [Rhodosporidium toruloides] n=1 Tax=Rhodotorula toruloides TaxID=5286 RepID=A0A0K3CBG4_RHOTO|nr:F-box domain, cyclin-like domain containing protein [Rhodotorula toruloides]
MPSLREAKAVSYGVPDQFLELERDFKRQAKAAKTKEKSGASGGQSGAQKANGSSSPAERDEGSAIDEDEVDQLASDCDLDEELLKLAEDGARKKRRTGRGSGNGKTGDRARKREARKDRLSALPDEILLQIVGHASSPASLLSLSFVSCRFHKMLTSTERDDVWEEARARAGLPGMSEGGFTESQLAELVYGMTCFTCGKNASRIPDVFLRKRLCKSCRDTQIVRLDALDDSFGPKRLRRALRDCTLRSRQSPSQPKKLSKTHYGFLPHVQQELGRLLVLDQKDVNDQEAEYAAAFAKQHQLALQGRGIALARNPTDSSRSAYVFDFGRREDEFGPRVKAYVAKRREKLAPLEKESEALFEAIIRLEKEKEQHRNDPENGQPSARRQDLERRVLADPETDFQKSDFVESWLTEKLVNVGSVVTDEEWSELKPRILKVLYSARKKLQALELKSQQAARRDALKPYYEQLRQDQLSPAARTFFPLFADFLLFDSTRSLWEPTDALVNDESYNAARDAMEDEINEWRVDVRFYALQQILGCTLDIPQDEELSSDQDAYDAYDDGFFDLLTSALVCSIKPCVCSAENRATFFGSLPDLLDHQHEVHHDLKSSMTELYSKKASSSHAEFRFSLPLEVANAVVALCELCELDEETATPGDVDEFFEDDETARLQWHNAPRETHKKKERDWRVIMCRIKRDVDEAASAKSPHLIPPPGLRLFTSKADSE